MPPEYIGRYKIKEEIGRGGMATVYLAHDPRFNRDVAVKILPREFLHDPQFRGRFEREAKTLAALEHAAIVPVYDFGEQDGQLYLVMRYMPGGSLDDLLQGRKLPLNEALEILERIAPALEKAHRKGIVHRDLKPGNILLDQDGLPYLADFGLVKLRDASVAYTGSAVLGTPTHMSPEQAKGEKDIDGRSDIYALGAILFQAISGMPPYDADTAMGIALKHITEPVPSIREVEPGFSAELDRVLQRAMAKDPQDRYQTVSDLVEALKHAILTSSTPSAEIKTAASQPLPAQQTLRFESTASESGDLGSQKTPSDKPPHEIPGLSDSGSKLKWIPMFALGVLLPAFIIVILMTGGSGTATATPDRIPSHTPSSTRFTSDLPTATLRPAQIAATLMATSAVSNEMNRQMVTPQDDRNPRVLFDPQTITELARYSAEGNSFRKVAWSPDGLWLASDEHMGAYEDSVINVWYATSFDSIVWQLQTNTWFIEGLSWSPDGSMLASGNQNGIVQIWAIESGEETLRFQASTGSIVNLSWSPDISRLATAGGDERIKIWDTENGELLLEICCHTFRKFIAGDVAWSNDAGLIASVANDSTIRIWDSTSGAMQRAVCCTDSEWSRAVSWSPDGTRLAAASYSALGAGSVTIWNTDTWAQDRMLEGNTMSIMDFDWSPDGSMIVASGNDGSIYFWNVDGGELLRKLDIMRVNPDTNWVYNVDWSPNGAYVAIGSDDGTLRIWGNPE
jgi:serine/threonine protein kinase/Tol biopolymer transport system component